MREISEEGTKDESTWSTILDDKTQAFLSDNSGIIFWYSRLVNTMYQFTGSVVRLFDSQHTVAPITLAFIQ